MLRAVLFDLQGMLLATDATPPSAHGHDAWELYTPPSRRRPSLHAAGTSARRLAQRPARRGPAAFPPADRPPRTRARPRAVV